MKFLLVFLIIPSLAICQNTKKQNLWRLTVADSISSKGIYKSTISINNKNYYTTNSNGRIDIPIATTSDNKIIISCVGYKKKVFLASFNKYPDTIKLTSLVVALNEVKISASALPVIHMGEIKSSSDYVHRVTSPNCSYADLFLMMQRLKELFLQLNFR